MNTSIKSKECGVGLILLFVLLHLSAQAGSATWKLNPVNSDWNTAANWTPETVPNERHDVATFGVSNITTITTTPAGGSLIDSVVFEPGASAYTFSGSIYLRLTGAGIINNSGIIQRVSVGREKSLDFIRTADAGSNLQAIVPGGTSGIFSNSGSVTFSGSASAGSGLYVCKGAEVDSHIDNAMGAVVEFSNSSTAANGSFTLKGGLATGAKGASMQVTNTASLGNATITLEGGVAGSQETSMEVFADSTGSGANLSLFGNSNFYIGNHNAPGFTLGSLQGDGGVFLGNTGGSDRTLVVGNNRNTTFSGVIDDMGANGSLTKVGGGSLTLTGSNTYLGTTLIQQGQLLVSNTGGSGTGSGPLQVRTGSLGGTGTIAGPVTLGTGSGRGATVAPGSGGDSIGTLTIGSSLLCKGDGAYTFDVDTDAAAADQLVADGVTIESGAMFSPAPVGSSVVPPGTVFIAIDNTSATPVSGTFSNLPDGGIVSVGSTNFQASYSGGDGNDLTLTALP